MSTVKIKDTHWPKILQFLCSCPGIYVGRETQCRRFIEAVLWITRSGAQWRLLPEEYGNWNSVYKRYARWCDNGIWELSTVPSFGLTLALLAPCIPAADKKHKL